MRQAAQRRQSCGADLLSVRLAQPGHHDSCQAQPRSRLNSPAGGRTAAEILQRDRPRRLGFSSQNAGNQGIEKVCGRRIACRHRLGEVESTCEQAAVHSSSFKQIGVSCKTLRYIDCADHGFAGDGSLVHSDHLPSLDQIVELKITPAV